jgi:endo-1,4-beta-xylanase
MPYNIALKALRFYNIIKCITLLFVLFLVLTVITFHALAGPNGRRKYFGGTPTPAPGQKHILWFGTYEDPGNPAYFPDKIAFANNPGSIGPYTCIRSSNGCYWSDLEPSQGNYNWAHLDAMLKYAASANLSFCTSTISLSVSSLIPSYISGLSDADKLTALGNFLQAFAARYPASKIPWISVLNEPISGAGIMQNALGGTGSTGYDWAISLCQLYRQYFPGRLIGANETGADKTDGFRYPQFLDLCTKLTQRGLIDWVGLEGYGLESTPNINITNAINSYGVLGVPVWITELTIGNINNVFDQDAQLARWQDLLENVFVPNPYVQTLAGPWSWRRSDAKEVGSVQTGWILDDTVTPYVEAPTNTWLRSYIPTILTSSVTPPLYH